MKKKISFLIAGLLVAGFGYYYFNARSTTPVATPDNTNSTEVKGSAAAQSDIPKGLPPMVAGEAIEGTLTAPAKLITYCSFTSDYCPEFLATAEQARIDFGDRLAIAYRPWYDRTDVLGESAAIAAYCAGQAGKLREFTTGLFEYTKNGDLSLASIDNVAAKIGLTSDEFVACRRSEDTLATVTAIVDAASAASVVGVPTFFLNGYVYAGAYPYEDFERSDGTKEKGLKSLIREELGE